MRSESFLLFFSFIASVHSEVFTQLFQTRLIELQKLGFNPRYILDVGANMGDFTLFIKDVFKSAEVFMIEGNPLHNQRLKSLNIPFEIALVGETERNATMYTTKTGGSDQSGAGVFIEDSSFYDSRNRVGKILPMKTIDGILKHQGLLGKVDFIKVDVQGAELIALKGAKRALRHAEFVLIEVPILQYNKGSSSFLDTQVFMDAHGFAIMDIIDLRYIGEMNMKKTSVSINNDGYYGRKLLQMDVLWVRRTSKYFSRNATEYDSFPASSELREQCSHLAGHGTSTNDSILKNDKDIKIINNDIHTNIISSFSTDKQINKSGKVVGLGMDSNDLLDMTPIKSSLPTKQNIKSNTNPKPSLRRSDTESLNIQLMDIVK